MLVGVGLAVEGVRFSLRRCLGVNFRVKWSAAAAGKFGRRATYDDL